MYVLYNASVHLRAQAIIYITHSSFIFFFFIQVLSLPISGLKRTSKDVYNIAHNQKNTF